MQTCHLLLRLVHLVPDIGGQAFLEPGAEAALDVAVQLPLVLLQHLPLGPEGRVELVHERRQPPDLLAESQGHLESKTVFRIAILVISVLICFITFSMGVPYSKSKFIWPINVRSILLLTE